MIYLDNAATSYPKPDSVYKAVQYAMSEVGATPGRASHKRAREASSIVAAVREKAARLFGISDSHQVAFTKSATESINVVLKGWLRPGDRVLISGMEHNAVARPLAQLSASSGVVVERVPSDPTGCLDVEALQRSLLTPARLMVLVHASNVNGALQPASDVARLLAEIGVPLLLDAAQTAGIQPIDAEGWKLGMLACSGHKGLLGPPGMGILYVRRDLDVLPLVEGGTGSQSEEEKQPELRPDCFESGTPNLPGIAGLGAGIDFIQERGLDAIRNHEITLASILEERLGELSGITILRPRLRGTGVVSFTVAGMNSSDVGYILDEVYDIGIRTGLHCAPLAHQVLGTFPEGAIRVSPGLFNTAEEIETFINAIRHITSHRHLRR